MILHTLIILHSHTYMGYGLKTVSVAVFVHVKVFVQQDFEIALCAAFTRANSQSGHFHSSCPVLFSLDKIHV